MAAAQEGDRASYERLLRELLPVIRGLVRARIPETSAAEDVVQNVLLSIHRARHTYRPERPFGPWLRAIARNASADHGRARWRRARREVPLDSVPEPEAPLERASGDLALSPGLAAALEELPASQREAVELLHLRGLSVAEAAVRVGVTPGALKVRAHRGYQALRARLGSAPDAEPGEGGSAP